jgi:hypothetical protein
LQEKNPHLFLQIGHIVGKQVQRIFSHFLIKESLMKTFRFFKTTMALLAVSAVCALTSCDKEDDDVNNDKTYAISGNASGSQETPAVTTSATGTLSGSYDSKTNMLTYSISWSGLSGNATVAHFHGPALAGVAANPIHDISIATNGINGTASGTITLADSTESHLLNGKLYYNLHTVMHPNGEIRGQVTASPN